MPTTLRTPAERAAGLERLGPHASNPFFAEAARVDDAVALRKRLEAKHHVSVIRYDARGNEVLDFHAWDRRHAMQKRISRVCDWAKRRMKAADEAFALRSVELELAA